MSKLCLSLLALLLLSPAISMAADDEVVTVPAATVHKQPAGGSENVTQVPMGDHVQVFKTIGGWAQVHVTDQYRLADGYPGWMLKSQLAPTSTADAEGVTVTIPRAALRVGPGAASTVLNHAYMGTRLAPTGKTTAGWMEVGVPGTRRTAWVAQAQVTAQPLEPTGEDMVRLAETFLGTRYVWGGISIDGIDCSGLTFIVYRVHGITLPRDADQQFEVGTPVPADQLETGDLVFYGKRRDHITHVAIYAGKGEIVEASSSGSAVRVSLLNHRNDYQGARRVIGVPVTMPPPSP